MSFTSHFVVACLFGLAIGMASPVSAAAENESSGYFWTGEELIEVCRAVDSSKPHGAIAKTYAAAVSDMLSQMQDWAQIPKSYCPPEITSSQTAAVICKHIEDRPEEWHYAAAPLSIEALLDAWACDEDKASIDILKREEELLERLEANQ